MQDDMIELQTRLAFQEEGISQLNDIVTRQQQEIDQLRRDLRQLRDKYLELQELTDTGNGSQIQEIPPHY